MKQYYKVTLRTCDIFNFTTSVILKQYDTKPKILGVHESKDGQLVDLRISCTQTEKFLVRAALKDYILKMVPVNAKGRGLSFQKGWQNYGINPDSYSCNRIVDHLWRYIRLHSRNRQKA